MVKPIITLTPKAVLRVQEIVKNKSDAIGLRVKIVSSGCSGHSYKFEIVKAGEEVKTDSLVEQDEVKIYIEQKSLLYLLGAEMDFVEDKFKSAFIFNNPNEEDACGCGQSVNFKIQ